MAPVLPLVVYHGPRAWQVGEHFGALFAGPKPLRLYWPEFRFPVYDLSAYRDEELVEDGLLEDTRIGYQAVVKGRAGRLNGGDRSEVTG